MAELPITLEYPWFSSTTTITGPCCAPGVGVGDGDGVGVGVGDGEGVGVGLGFGVGDGEGGGVGLGDGFGAGVGEGLGAGFGDGVGVGVAFDATVLLAPPQPASISRAQRTVTKAGILNPPVKLERM